MFFWLGWIWGNYPGESREREREREKRLDSTGISIPTPKTPKQIQHGLTFHHDQRIIGLNLKGGRDYALPDD